jgi:hypothetical protein
MTPFLTFLAIIVVIWTLSGIATAVNKKNEAERRRQLALQLQRASMQGRAPAAAQRPRRISEGLAARFPDVLLPPAPPPQRMQAPPLPPRRQPAPQQRKKQQQRRGSAPQQRRVAAPPPPPVPAAAASRGSAPLSTAAPAVQSAHDRAASAVRAVDAAALARWARPATLRQQFMLTEIFQPPLALRDQS